MSFEQPLTEDKRRKKIKIFVFSIILFIVIILLGTIGYKFLFNLTWLDAFYNAATIFSGSKINPTNTTQKVFLIIYTLSSTVIFFSIATHAIKDIIDLFKKE